MILRKRPPQLSLHDELQQVYDDCCSITIKNLTLEEESRVEDALKGWKSLHTSLLFKIDSFEKSNRKMDEEEQNILNEIKSIRDQNVKHLIRVQLRMDEVNRKNSTNKLQPILKQNSSQNSSQSNSLPIPSLRSSNPIKSRSFTNSNNGNQRSLLKSLRPTPSNISSYKTTKNNKGSKSGEASSAAILSWLRPPPPKPEQNVNNIEEADNLFQDFDQDSFEFNDTNWEHIRDYTESPPNLIDMDDNAVSGNKLSQSMDDLTIKPVPNASSTKAASLKPRPPVQNWKSIPDLKQDKPRPYVYAKPKPINIDQLMKPKGASRSAIPQPKMQSSLPPKAASSKPRQALAPQAKKLNITYQYIKAPNSVAQKKQGLNKKPVRTKAPLEKEELNSPTMDDLLGAYNTQDQNVAEFSDPSAELLDEMKQDELIASVRGLDPIAAKQILNDIVVHGDEVFWDDIVGLEGAKNSLKEAVVYPFLRPDLFKGLREPTRGMLLFGPPGTGKTMLARAVATESKSTFFSITASSLTSKYLGESEKLVRALFILAKKLSPSIVFIDEIDSLLSSRSDNDNESSRRIKNEFLIQWSELSSAAAARDKESDDRVLILGATNLPWSIDEAARRRFVRRQYIPLPEDETRKHQIIKLLKYQKNTLSEDDHEELIKLTEGFSGSDITALAKDGAMGPLRSLGDKLLLTPTEQIRPIDLNDFRTSLKYIRPSVSHEGLEEYEKWAIKFGSSGA